MALTEGMVEGGPEAQRGSAGAVRRMVLNGWGLKRRDVSARCRCLSESPPKLLQNSGCRPQEPMSVQDGVHGFPAG